MNEGLNVGEICESAAHSSDITSCHFSKNGVLATSSSDHTVKLWALKNKELKEIATLKGHKYGVNFCRFSPQGTLLASASTDSTTIIWDVKTGDNLGCLVQPSGFAVRVCQFCPHSSFLATAGDDDLVCIWNIGEKELVRTIKEHEATIFSLDFSPDGNILLTSDTVGRCKVWAAQPNHSLVLAEVEEAHDLGVNSVCFSPLHSCGVMKTSYSVATCGNDGFLSLWALVAGAENSMHLARRVFAHQGSAMCVHFAADGQTVASSGGDKVIKIWVAEDLTCLSLLEGHERYVMACAFSMSGKLLASGSSDRTFKVWILDNTENHSIQEEIASSSRVESYFQLKLVSKKQQNTDMQTLTGHSSDINSCHFHDDVLATGSADATVRLWKENKATKAFEETPVSPLKGHSYSVYCVQFSPNGSLVSASLDGSLILWDAVSGTQLKVYQHPERTGFRVLRVTPDCKLVIAGGDDNCCHVWNLETDKVEVLVGHENTVLAIGVSFDGEILVTGCSGGSLRLWDIEALICLIVLDDVHDLGLTSCAFKPIENASEIVTAGNDAEIKIWSLDQRKKLTLRVVLAGHSGPVMGLAFSTNGSILASTSGDKTVKIWEADSYHCLATLGPHSRYVTCGDFGKDSEFFAASFDRFVKIWRLSLDRKFSQENCPASEWTHRQVGLFLVKEGFAEHVESFSQISGKDLLKLSLKDIEALGVFGEDAGKCLQKIQWARFGGKESDGFVDDIPDEYLCPITYDLMVNPVKCGDGFVYEETAITEWLMTRKNTSPMTNLEINDNNLVPCNELRLRIDKFRKSF